MTTTKMTRTATSLLLLTFPTATESFGRQVLLTREKKLCSFVPSSKCVSRTVRAPQLWMSTPEEGGDKGEGDAEGVELAADFAKILQQRNIEMGKLDFYDVEEGDEEDEEEDEEEEDAPDQTAADAKAKDDFQDEDEEEDSTILTQYSDPMSEYDASEFDEEVASSVQLTDKQVSQELNERVLETAGGFVEYLKGVDEDDDDQDDDSDSEKEEEVKVYTPPDVVPDPDLTAGEVVTLVMEALANNDVPTPNRGVEILFEYYSPRSSVKADPELTAEEYAEFLKETEYRSLFEASEVRIERGDYASDSRRAFFTVRCNFLEGPTKDFMYVNFILSTERVGEDDCWMIDSILIRPEGLRRKSRG